MSRTLVGTMKREETGDDGGAENDGNVDIKESDDRRCL